MSVCVYMCDRVLLLLILFLVSHFLNCPYLSLSLSLLQTLHKAPICLLVWTWGSGDGGGGDRGSLQTSRLFLLPQHWLSLDPFLLLLWDAVLSGAFYGLFCVSGLFYLAVSGIFSVLSVFMHRDCLNGLL